MRPVLKSSRNGFYPNGAIVPYNSAAAAPTGWANFSSADGYYVIGAGSTYAVGATGGSNDIGAVTSTTSGSHTANTSNVSYGTASAGLWKTPLTAGDHNHALSNFLAISPYMKFRLIKSSGENNMLPVNALVFSRINFGSKLTEITSTHAGRYLAAAASVSGLSSWSGLAPTVASGGDHTHISANQARMNAGAVSTSVPSDATFNHTHTTSGGSVTDSIKRRWLRVWTNASAAFNVFDGQIVMWEQSSAPRGWTLCDGTLGTVDLRDYFVISGTSGDQTSTSSIIAAITLDSNTWNHGHIQTRNRESAAGTVSAGHSTKDAAHEHSYSGTISPFLPPYYALTFIQKR